MKNVFILFLLILLFADVTSAQQNPGNSSYKKRVLETTEIDILSSFYHQTGENASVTGGIGSEELTDFAPDIVITIPLNADDILTFDVGISTYTSASSSNLNPFDISGPLKTMTKTKTTMMKMMMMMTVILILKM